MTADPDQETRSIHELLPRRSAFKRKSAGAATREQVIAANLDIVFLVSGLDGDFNLRRIERYVTQAWSSGATPVILLNKTDVCDDVEGRLLATRAVAPGVNVHAVSAKDGTGLEEIGGYLRSGITIALLGSSGVGKSTLLNLLIGERRMEVGEIREDDSRGRHTTTHREMIILPSGALLIDTPGMRELQLWSSSDDVDQTFSEVAELAASCRFNDCTHTNEPGCAVLQALESGDLSEDRYLSHQKLVREVAYLERRQDESAVFKQRQRDKKFAKMVREVIRHKKDKGGR
jgi:ribosome biogenesis GTPase